MIYAVLVEDHHTNPRIELFKERVTAEQFCREYCEDFAPGEKGMWPEIDAQIEAMNKDANANGVWYFTADGDCCSVLELENPK